MIKYFIYRFPIILLIFTTSSIIINFFSIFNINYNIENFIIFLLTALVFLFHIRIIDDYRDFEHDTKYYSERELQKWKINLKYLFIVWEVLMFIIFIINFYYFWFLSLIILFLWWLNNLISINYFWFWKKIEKNFMIIFHILNNLTLNSFFIYLYLNLWVLESFSNNYLLIILHLIFINLLIFLMEISRKIKSKNDKNTFDKYIDKYGYSKNNFIILFIILSIFILINIFIYKLNLLFFSWIYIFYNIMSIIFTILLFLHLKYKTIFYKNLLIIFSILYFLFSNIYFLF